MKWLLLSFSTISILLCELIVETYLHRSQYEDGLISKMVHQLCSSRVYYTSLQQAHGQWYLRMELRGAQASFQTYHALWGRTETKLQHFKIYSYFSIEELIESINHPDLLFPYILLYLSF